ncbi:MAG: hypothetical protein IK045_00310 [Bacteroidales bacterium]|nr:hypothetical protein [Bacteroidales bacterium]
MKKFLALFSIAAAIAAVSCTREQLVPEEPVAPAGKTVITLTTEMTRTTMGELSEGKRPVYWANGDKIAVNGEVSDALAGLEANSRSASFSFTDKVIVAPYKAVYPETIWKNDATVTLPATYSASGIMPLSGYGDDNNITVTPLTAALKLSIKRYSGENPDTDIIKRIDVSSEDGQLSGDFSIDFETGALTPADPTASMVSLVKNLNLSDQATEVFIPVPAGTYNFKVRITDVQGHFMEIPTTGAKTLAAGEIKSMPVIEFVPTGTQIDVIITSAQNLIDFATNYNNKTWTSVVAKVINNIEFDATTSAAFNETGGIGLKTGVNGTEDYYFNGLFDGNGFTISGLQATVPLFVAIGDNGTVKDLTLDNTCSFTFTHPNTGEAMFGSVVGDHEGLLDNVKCAADISLAAVADVKYMTTLGGLVGYSNCGDLTGCEYSGLISTPPGFTATAPDDDPNLRKLIIGGLLGFSNTGSITGSYFKGAISNEAQIGIENESTESTLLKRNPFLIIGGLVGYLDGGATISSSSATADHETVQSAHSGATSIGHIVNKTTVAYFSACGGIVGELNKGTVSNCTNAATIFNTIFKKTTDGSRYMDTGGIVGKNNANGTVSNCTNNAKVQHRSNPKIQDLGGIAGYNAGTISSCTNTAEVNHMTTGVTGATKKGGRVVSIAGVIGENASGATVTDVHNTANIQISAMETNYDDTNHKPLCEARMGGVIAYNLADIDGGASKNITNTGQVYFNCNFEKQFTGYEIGGIVGYSTASVKNAKNSGYVLFNWASDAYVASKVYVGGVVAVMAGDGDIAGCVNEHGSGTTGEVYMNLKTGALHTDNHVGGILAYTTNDVDISNCTNSGFIHTSNYSATDKTLHVGGIAGSLAGKSSISECTNTGSVFLNAGNNTDNDADKIFAEGGIVGFVQGTAEDRIPISLCNWTYSSDVGARRGTCGGVAGYAKYADISSSDVQANYNMYNHITGGIVGWAVNSNITGCKFKGAKIAATQGYASGGIVAKLDAGSTVDGCYNYCKDITATKAPTVIGEIAASSVAGTTIKNCHHTGTISICSDDNFTDGGGNVVDP